MNAGRQAMQTESSHESSDGQYPFKSVAYAKVKTGSGIVALPLAQAVGLPIKVLGSRSTEGAH